jgi:hypothetical protein
VGNQAQPLRPVAFALPWFPNSIFTSAVHRGTNAKAVVSAQEKMYFAELHCAEQK